MPLVVQCGIVRIIVADSLRWKMLPTFVPGHTHCRGQHSILITPRATRKGYGKQTFRQICCYKDARSMPPSGNAGPDARVKIAPPNPRRVLRDAEPPRIAASVNLTELNPLTAFRSATKTRHVHRTPLYQSSVLVSPFSGYSHRGPREGPEMDFAPASHG